MSVLARLADRRLWAAAGVAIAAALVGTSPWWGPAALSKLSYFRVRRVEVVGARYVDPRAVYATLRVDTTGSVWQPIGVLEQRIASHPQVRRVSVERRLPGTLVVRITENLPVALVPTPQGLRPFDAAGGALPIDPSRVDVDLPVLTRRDTAALRLLADVRDREPALYARISEVRPLERGELLLVLPPYTVRALAGITADRLADIIPVEHDLARRRALVAELDLRFRDQVVARLQ